MSLFSFNLSLNTIKAIGEAVGPVAKDLETLWIFPAWADQTKRRAPSVAGHIAALRQCNIAPAFWARTGMFCSEELNGMDTGTDCSTRRTLCCGMLLSLSKQHKQRECSEHEQEGPKPRPPKLPKPGALLLPREIDF
jgi:hypothetical protein